jgi:hypothetical protein
MRTTVAELGITSFLQSSGLEDVTVKIHQLDQNQSQLPHFILSLPTAPGLLQINAQDTIINYKPGQLIDGRINSLVINSLELYLYNTDKAQAGMATEPVVTHKALQPVKIIAALRLALRKYLVVDTLFIRHITLHGEVPAALQGKVFQLKSIAKNESLDSKLSLIDQSSSKQSVTVRISADQLTAELSQTAADMIAARIELNIHDKELTGKFDIKPLPLQHWLQAFNGSAFSQRVDPDDAVKKADKINGNITFNFESDTEFITILTAESENLVYQAYTADNAAIKLKLKNSTIDPLQRLQIQNGSYIQADNISFQGFSLIDSRIYMIGELAHVSNNWEYKGGFSSSLLTAIFQSRAFLLKDVSARIDATVEKLNVSGNFSSAVVPGAFQFALDHKLARGIGSFSMKPSNPLDLDAENNKLSLLLVPWPYPFDLLSGKIILSLRAAWSEKDVFSLSTAINIDNAGGNVGELVFSGLSFDHKLQILPKLQSVSAGKMTVKHIDSGVIANNISTDVKLNTERSDSLPQVIVQNLYGEIFGGTFSANDLIYDLNNSANHFKIRATNIDLAEIVKTQQLDDIVASGRIDGIIPIEINENGVFIQDGAFINDVRNGTIRYNPATGTEQLKQNPITGIALDALKDFRYSHLSADVNFTPDGRLTINLQLKGTSPELDTSRPVHLNINTEQNLLSLLKSLRYAQGVSEKIDNKVRHLYNQNQ